MGEEHEADCVGMFHGDSVIHHICEARAVVDPLWERYIALMRWMSWDESEGALSGGDSYDDDGLAAAMERWNERVKEIVPADRLLVWNPGGGWDPLCEFLGVAVPVEPLPRLNDTLSFREGIIGGALDVLGEWWNGRERPAEGLHGAALT